ncbi:MAG: hypothetical protein SGJ24_06905 [Chloroflexota bacterium]|nr:hypothetical protein [Chloroflexota bacterium]
MPETIVTPETGGYLLLGIAVVVMLMAGFAGWIAARFRSLRRDLETLETLAHDDEA